jgi:hypothetical protein
MITQLLIFGVHIAGAVTFHYIGNWYALLPGALVTTYAMYNFVKVSALTYSPAWEIELEYDDYDDIDIKILSLFASAITIYLMYTNGFALWAGAAAMFKLIVGWSYVLTYISFGGEDEE